MTGSFSIQLAQWGKALLGSAVPFPVLWFAAAALLALVLAGGVSAFSGVASYVERKVAAHMQARMGPMRVGPHGIFQWMADGLKVLLKEDLIPAGADQPLFRLAPYIVFLGSFPVFLVMPFGPGLIVSDLNIGILYMVAVASLVVMGLLMSGWASGNKWALFGAMRSAAQIVSYEIPIGLTILAVVMLVGSLSMADIVRAQERGFPFDIPLPRAVDAGGDGWGGCFGWFLFRYPPFTLAAFLLYFTASLAETNRTPFDIPEAESELVAGFHTEYSGMRFSIFFMAEYANMLAVAGIATTLFLGGWLSPLPHPYQLADAFAGSPVLAGVAGAAEGLAWFLGKAFILIFVMMWLRWTLPRYRVDQLMDLCWKVLVPVAFVNLVAIAILYQGGALWQQLMRLA
jgi:NADH-quinone oxidoreductase subunit H